MASHTPTRGFLGRLRRRAGSEDWAPQAPTAPPLNPSLDALWALGGRMGETEHVIRFSDRTEGALVPEDLVAAVRRVVEEGSCGLITRCATAPQVFTIRVRIDGDELVLWTQTLDQDGTEDTIIPTPEELGALEAAVSAADGRLAYRKTALGQWIGTYRFPCR